MATVYWTPRAVAVAQVSSGSIDSLDGTPANNTFHVSVGEVTISQVGTTDAQTTAAALVALLQSSTHPYISAVTWTAPGAGVITGTADVAGVPFVAALTETGAGTGAVTDFSDDTAATSPHHVNAAANWSGGALPTTGDDVIVADSSVSMLWELDALTSVALSSFTVRLNFTGRIGLERSGYASTVDAATIDPTYPDYRDHYLEISAPLIVTGRDTGVGASTGSSRIKIKNTLNGASLMSVEDTSASADGTRAAVRYLSAHANADVEIYQAPGGFSIAADEPGEASTVGNVEVMATSPSTRVVIGPGVTLTSYVQAAGDGTVSAAATVASIENRGGELDVIGEDYTVTHLIVRGGRVRDRHTQSSGSEWTEITTSGGVLDLTGTGEARTADEWNPDGGQVDADWDDLTVTAVNLPTGRASVTILPT